jgi:hypothetical protein
MQGLRPCYTSRIAKFTLPFLFLWFLSLFSSCAHGNALSPQLYLTTTFPDGSGETMDERESFNKRIVQLCSFRFLFSFGCLFSWNKTHITVVCCDQGSLASPSLSSSIRGLATARHRWFLHNSGRHYCILQDLPEARRLLFHPILPRPVQAVGTSGEVTRAHPKARSRKWNRKILRKGDHMTSEAKRGETTAGLSLPSSVVCMRPGTMTGNVQIATTKLTHQTGCLFSIFSSVSSAAEQTAKPKPKNTGKSHRSE